MKYVIALLFIAEMIAPAFIAAKHNHLLDKDTKVQSTSHVSAADNLFAYLFEENNEEREGKDYDIELFIVADVVNPLAKFCNITASREAPFIRYSSQPSIYTLNRVLRI